MKSVFVIATLLMFCQCVVSQNKDSEKTNRENRFEPQPQGFVFVPQGSYHDTTFLKNDTIIDTKSVAPFWMSNEITNKEYREFVIYLQAHLQDSLCYVDWRKAKRENAENKTDKERFKVCVSNKEIAKNIIDTTLIFKDKPEYKNYFSNKKYDEFPVVGVSFKSATFFAIWKTKNEYEKGSRGNDYRLPVFEEWKYVRTMALKEKGNKNEGLQKSTSGIKNELKLCNLSGNVSEWTSSAPDPLSDEKRIIMGGSWKTKPDLYEMTVADKNEESSSVGFRLVKSYGGSGK